LSNEEIGSEDAYERFLKEGYSKLLGAVYLMVNDKGIAEDIVQETFARAYLNWTKLWPVGNPGGWTYRVASNLATSWRRKLIREAKMLSRLKTTVRNPGPEELVDPDLQRLVAGLPTRQRQAVVLHYVLGLPLEEIATAMKVRVGTVKSCLHAARESLRRKL
jgi:RNA polymerase sigma-70 factor (ECF subfamily)